MWSNARGCPRVNGGGPLAVLATSVCSGRGGRRLVSQGGARLSQGGLPPTPPLDDPLGGCCLKGGLPPTPPLDDPLGGCCLKGGLPPTPPLDDPLGDSWGWGGRRGVVPGGLRGSPAGVLPPWRAAPAPPHPHPLPQGARGPEGLPVRVGAWGRSPHIKKVRGRVGGPRAAQRARPGWGCGGPCEVSSRPDRNSPPQETRGGGRGLSRRRR